MSNTELDERLNDLWQRRADLDQAGWEALYTLIARILSGYTPSILGALPDDKADYICDFFTAKVYEPGIRRGDGVSARIHAGAMRKFFDNYLHDCLDTYSRNVLHKEGNLYLDQDEGDESRGPQEVCGCADIALEVLHEYGLDARQVSEAAHRWLATQEPWVVLYLGLHHCPDPDASLPLVHLSERHAIASYHHKARKLGLTRRKEDRDRPWFRESLLGQWLEHDLNLAIDPDNGPALQAALDLLCQAALARATEDPSKSTTDPR